MLNIACNCIQLFILTFLLQCKDRIITCLALLLNAGYNLSYQIDCAKVHQQAKQYRIEMRPYRYQALMQKKKRMFLGGIQKREESQLYTTPISVIVTVS